MPHRESPAKHRARGYIRVTRRHGEKMQQAALSDICGAIYRADDPSGLDDLLRSLRSGDAVMVTTLGRLASRFDDLGTILGEIHKRKAVLIETGTGRRSDVASDVVSMMVDARSELLGEARAFNTRTAKKAARNRWAKHGPERMPEEDARRIWHDRRIATMTEALSQMSGWSMTTAYRRLGKRHAPAGRPRTI
ncbi:MAG: recombinase family protein [Pseudomonadota bacterium]